MRRTVLLLALVACNLPTDPERNCEDRQVFYADPDGDGLGDPYDTYVGCEAPEGYVDTPGPIDTGDTDTGDTDTGDTDTDDTDT